MATRLSVAILWHMHQPRYFDPAVGTLTLPWVRLHAVKDYLDMLALVAEFPAVRLTFNLSPCLWEQLAWYGQGHQDAWEALASRPAESLNEAEASALARQCTFAHPRWMVAPWPRYAALVAAVGRGRRLTAGELRDLTVWFHLAWTDPRWRRGDPWYQALLDKGREFSEAEKTELLTRHRAIMARVLPAYAAAQARGQIEVATSPYYHPILPLLVDSESAREATPGLPGPSEPFARPGDAEEQVRRAAASYAQVFGRPPRGLWPSEGSVSEAIVPMVACAGFQWMATDEAILWKSLGGAPPRAALYQPYRATKDETSVAVVFRDRTLSDLVGFTYAASAPKDAADDLMRRLRAIRDEAETPAPLVAIILDGENAWEHYPDDGEPFLRRLYEALSRDPSLRCVTISDYLAEHPPQAAVPRLATGSWIRGDFTTWIGDPVKNRAWEWLAQARAMYDRVSPGHPRAGEAFQALLVAEGSDWFWWYGPEHSSALDEEFDRLFRGWLSQVYTTLGVAAPPALASPAVMAPAGRPIAPSRWITPTIDGIVTDYFEWLSAGRWDCAWGRGAMAPGQDRLQRIWWGCDAAAWYLRWDLATWPGTEPLTLVMTVVEPAVRIQIELTPGGASAAWARLDGTRQGPAEAVAAARIIEAKFPLALLGMRPGLALAVSVQVRQQDMVLDTVPSAGTVTLTLPGESDEQTHWSA